MKLIALNGAKTVGKTTIAEALKLQSADIRIISFATPLRSMLKAIGVDDHYLNVAKEEPVPGLGQSAREMLCSLGTEWGRNMVNESIWLWAMGKQIDEVVYNYKGGEDLIIVIDDCRFPNEAEWLRLNGGKLVHLSREGVEYTKGHDSELPLPKHLVDYELDAGDIENCVNIILSI
jgi:hypothetical protein